MKLIKLGLNFPKRSHYLGTITLEYVQNSKVGRRCFELDLFKPQDTADSVATDLSEKFPNYLSTVKHVQLTRLIQKLQDYQHKISSNSIVSEQFGDLNRVSHEQLLEAKDKMNVLFQKNKVGTDSKDFQYDKRVEFAPADQDSNWDD